MKLEKILVIDTETTGLFDFKQPADAEGQPRMASIAMIEAVLVHGPTPDSVPQWFQQLEYHTLIRPDGWEMTPEAFAVNGLTTERLADEGIPIAEILERYVSVIERGDTVIVAHNATFDTKVCRAELRRAGMDDLYTQTQTICTMMKSNPICKIPKANGRGIKWPTLDEAYQFFMGRPRQGKTHDSLIDARDCFEGVFVPLWNGGCFAGWEPKTLEPKAVESNG
jgi:DNA polymerase III epsilon subunit-like protein